MRPSTSLYGLTADILEYDTIPAWPNGYSPHQFFQHFPGVYCKQCGKVFALYSYSICQPHGLDENHKPYYNSCFLCYETKDQARLREEATEKLRRQGQELRGGE